MQRFLLVHRGGKDRDGFHAVAESITASVTCCPIAPNSSFGCCNAPEAEDDGDILMLRLLLDERDQAVHARPLLHVAVLVGGIVAPERKDVEQDRVDVVSHGEEGVFATVTAGRSARKRVARVLELATVFSAPA